MVDVSSVPAPPDAPLESVQVLMPEPLAPSAQEKAVATTWFWL